MRSLKVVLMLLAVVSLTTGCEMQVPGGDNGGDDGSGDMNTNGPDMNTNGSDVDTNGEENETLAKFQDPDSDFETTEVRDVDGEIMQFDTATEELDWQPDGSRIANWRVEGTNLIFGNSTFRARFGTEDGQRRVYFTEVNPPTICDLVVNNGALSIFSTNTEVPQE